MKILVDADACPVVPIIIRVAEIVIGRVLTKQYVQSRKTKAGYNREITVYSGDCTGYQFKSACIKGNNCKMPMEERNKVLNVSKYRERQRKECLARLTRRTGLHLYELNKAA